MALSAGLQEALQALRDRNYRYYLGGGAVSFIGSWMQRIAVGWLTWEMTGSTTWLGIMAAADLLPSVVLGPVGGAVADRYDRLKLMRLTQVAAMLQSVVLVVLLLLGVMTVWLLFGLTLVLGITYAFMNGAGLALVPSIIPRESLSAAVALSSVMFNSARFIGPAIAGVVIARWGTTEAIVATSVTYAVFLAALTQVKPLGDERRIGERRSFMADLGEGFSYAAQHTGIAAMLILLFAISIGGRAVNELLPKFSDDVFEAGATGFAMLMSGIGVGAVAVGLWLSARGNAPGLTRIAVGMGILQAVAVVALTFMPTLVLALPVMAVFGFASSGVGIASQTLMQLAVDGAMRGRVLSLFGMIFRGGPALGALVIGYAADYVGIEWPVFIAGVSTGLICLWLWLRRVAIAQALEK